MLRPAPYKFVLSTDGGLYIDPDMLKHHKTLAAEVTKKTGQQPIAAGNILTYPDGTYEVTRHFAPTLELWDFTPEHREMLAKGMRGAWLMRERGTKSERTEL